MNYGGSGLTVRYGSRLALDAVNLDVPAADVTAVVGGDGAGKTTLLRVLVGLVRPDDGVVRRPDKLEIGYFGAASGVYPDLSVDENIDFAVTAYRIDRETAQARRAELLAAAGLTQVGRRLAGHLSGGMRQKLGMVMAMVHHPKLLVLDEPSTGVDPVSRAELSALMVRAAARGTAVLLSTTYLDEAERATQVLVLDRGRALAAGPPAGIVADVPGSVVQVTRKPQPTTLSWRRGIGWHMWVAPGEETPAGATPVRPDLEDAVVVAALRRTGLATVSPR